MFGNVDKKEQKFYKAFFQDLARLNANNMEKMIAYAKKESLLNVNVSDLQDKVFYKTNTNL